MKFKSKLFLAPMSGITDIAFRLRCLEYGAGLVSIPMINVNAIARSNKATINLLTTIPEEKPKSVQLFGTKTELIKQAAKIAYEATNCDIIDFNMGCPKDLILKQGAGAALLKRPEKIKEIVEALRSVNIPISIKIRIGGSEKSINALKNAKIIEKAGADMLIVHGRTIEQGYSGKANLQIIKEIKENISIPVVGNGDVVDEESAKRMLDETKCDYIMVGRKAIGHPFIFEKINHYLETGKKLNKEYGQKEEFLKYFELAKKYNIRESKIKQQSFYFKTPNLHIVE